MSFSGCDDSEACNFNKDATDDDGVHSLSDGNIGPYTMKLKELLVGIQREDIDDDFGWLFPIE